MPGSPESAARTRGSNWPASATTSSQPGSATAAPRMIRGICSAPPPRLAHRPDTTPPTTYSGRNRPSRTQASRQAQPCATWIRDSSLYWIISGAAGWSTCRSSQLRVEARLTPCSAKARSTWAGESGLIGRPPSACWSSATSAASFGGCCWLPPRGRGPSNSTSSASCASALHGSPSWPISAAISPPADSAAHSSRVRAGSAVAAIRRCCSAWTATRAVSGSVPGGSRLRSGAKRESWSLSAAAGPSGRSAGTGCPCSRAQAAPRERGSP